MVILQITVIGSSPILSSLGICLYFPLQAMRNFMKLTMYNIIFIIFDPFVNILFYEADPYLEYLILNFNEIDRYLVTKL